MPKKACQHRTLWLTPSPNAEKAGFNVLSQKALASAATNKNLGDGGYESAISTYPAPLILPDDALDIDPNEGGQSLLSWQRASYRNKVTVERRVIYVVPPPSVSSEVEESVGRWVDPVARGVASPECPSVKDLIDYLGAYYHDMPVAEYAGSLRFRSWEEETGPSKTRKVVAARQLNIPKLIGLATNDKLFGIRARRCKEGTFVAQLNLNDILDVAMAILPSDAYAIIMMVDHDLYEDDEDDFVCGRAFGGSRICTVSTARYNPVLDDSIKLDRQHAWPASHCDAFVRQKCGLKLDRKRLGARAADDSPMRAAVTAFLAASDPPPEIMWLERVCRTASHELGHCFGLGHCPYNACMMQGTASVTEDVRQPPYLCPVDEAKILHALGCITHSRNQAILNVCDKFGSEGGMFAGYAAWLKARLEMDKQTNDSQLMPGSTSSCPIVID